MARRSIAGRGAAAAVALLLSVPVAAVAGGPLGGGPAGGVYYFLGTASLPGTSVADRLTICSEPNTRVIGGGFDVDAADATGRLQRSQPVDAGDDDDKPDDGWWVWGANQGAVETTLHSYAICSFDPVKYRARTERVPAGETQTVKAPCPEGTRGSAGGVETPNDNFVSVSGIYPIDGADGGTKPDDGWAARVWNFTAQRAFVTVHAICLPGARMFYGTTEFDIGASGTSDFFAPICPDDAHVTGGGSRSKSPLSTQQTGITAAVPTDFGGSETDAVPDDRFIFQARNDDPLTAGTIRYFTACLVRG